MRPTGPLIRTALVVTWWSAVLSAFLVGVAPLAAADEASAPAVAAEPALRMRPFKVFAEWIEIQPLLKKGVIESVRVVQVQRNSPAAAAGIAVGMRIIELQGITVTGMVGNEFKRRLESLPASDRLTLKVRTGTSNGTTVVAVPLNAVAPASAGGDTARVLPAASPGPRAAGAAGGPGNIQPLPAVAMDAAAVKQRLETVRRSLAEEMARVRVEARATGRGMVDSYVIDQAARSLTEVPLVHLGLLCEAAVKADGNPDVPFLTSAIVNGITSRRDYTPEQKPIILNYLPKLPDLILTLDRMSWFEGTETVVAAGWKKARSDERDGVLGFRGSRYAVLAAQHGVTDALVTLARCVRTPVAEQRRPARRLADEFAVLCALVPSAQGDGPATADFILKHKSKLRFDLKSGTYALP